MLSMLDLVGWVGGGFTVLAYVMVSTRRWPPDSRAFQATNMLGAALLAVASLSRGALPSTFINVVWIVFGAQVLVQTARRRARRTAWDVAELYDDPAAEQPSLATTSG